jgi:hypothetical protein
MSSPTAELCELKFTPGSVLRASPTRTKFSRCKSFPSKSLWMVVEV